MGGFLSILPTILPPIMGAAQIGLGMAQDNQSLRSKNERTRAQNKNTNSEIRRRQIAADRKRREALKRSLATKRAKFGARGTGSLDGSSLAVLNGLIAQSSRDAADSARSSDAQVATNNQSANYSIQSSLLGASHQRQRILGNLLLKSLPLFSLIGEDQIEEKKKPQPKGWWV